MEPRTPGVTPDVTSDVVVVGASLSGLFAAAGAAAAGRRVTVLEADRLPAADAPRPGVPQSRQTHVFLHRGLSAAEELLPGLRADLLSRGAVPLDTGRLPWRTGGDWSLVGDHGYEVLSCTRPLLERVVRDRVRALPRVRVLDGAAVTGLHREDGGWVVAAAGTGHRARVVVEASGRSSRLPRRLAGLGVGPAAVERVDARIGYATRCYAGGAGTPLVLQIDPGTGRGSVVVPVEGGRWLVMAVGSGPHRPPRDPEGFEGFLRALGEPALGEQLSRWSAEGDVAVHRQTANVRHGYADVPGWPAGLLVTGDALCAFNPDYGQGITVGAVQALVLRDALARDRPPGAAATRRLLRRLTRCTDLPWSIATGVDRGFPAAGVEAPRRPGTRWVAAVQGLAAHGDVRASRVLQRSYHLVGSPAGLAHPALVAAALRARLRGPGPANPRPDALRAVADLPARTV